MKCGRLVKQSRFCARQLCLYVKMFQWCAMCREVKIWKMRLQRSTRYACRRRKAESLLPTRTEVQHHRHQGQPNSQKQNPSNTYTSFFFYIPIALDRSFQYAYNILGKATSALGRNIVALHSNDMRQMGRRTVRGFVTSHGFQCVSFAFERLEVVVSTHTLPSTSSIPAPWRP